MLLLLADDFSKCGSRLSVFGLRQAPFIKNNGAPFPIHRLLQRCLALVDLLDRGPDAGNIKNLAVQIIHDIIFFKRIVPGLYYTEKNAPLKKKRRLRL
jgi:hypothetical protein